MIYFILHVKLEDYWVELIPLPSQERLFTSGCGGGMCSTILCTFNS